MLILLDTNFMAACISSKIDVVGQLEERDVNFEFAVLKRAVVETSYLPPKVVRQVEAFMLANKPQLIGKGGKLEGNSRAEWKGTHPGEKLGLGEEKERKGVYAGKEGEKAGFGGDGKAVHSDAGKGVFGGKGVFNEGKAETEGNVGFNGGGRAETGGNGFFGVGRPSGNAEEPESEGHLNQTGHTDDLMVLFAKKHHAAVATLDKALKKRLKREGIPIITLARQRVVF